MSSFPGVVPSTMAFTAGVCALAGLYHLLIAVRHRWERVHLTFGLLSILSSAWTAFAILKYTTTDAEVYAATVQARLLIGHLLAIAGIWFFTMYANEPRRWPAWTLTVLNLAFIVVNEVLPFGAYHSGLPDLVYLTLPWGESVTRASGPFGFGYTLEFLISVPTGLYTGLMVHRRWREAPQDALWLGLSWVAVCAGYLGSAYAFGIAFPPAEIGFMALVVVMGLRMADQVAEAAKVEGVLTQTQARITAVMESSPEAILMLDGESGRALVANEKALELFGLSEEEVTSFHPLEGAPEFQSDGSPSASVFDRRLVSALAGNPSRFRWVVESGSGETFPCEALIVRLPGEDPVVIRLSLVDLRGLEAAEAKGAKLEEQLHQSLKLEAVGRLTGGVAHDFNNFLTVMRGNLELLQDDGGDAEERRQLLAEALAAADRSADLTQRLLAFSRNQPLAPRRVETGALVEEAAGLLQRTLGEHIRLHHDVPGNIWPILVDPTQLESALVNLAINAADAMEDGGRLDIGARNVHLEAEDYSFMDQLSPGKYVRVHVTDTGHGMDELTMTRVIEPFFTTKAVGKGSGLGLSMVYGFVTQSGGTMRIQSALGAGTTIFLYFPRFDPAPAEMASV